MSPVDTVGSGFVDELQGWDRRDAAVRLCGRWRGSGVVTAMCWHVALRPRSTRHCRLRWLDWTASGQVFH